jgi:hypothetical protein
MQKTLQPLKRGEQRVLDVLKAMAVNGVVDQPVAAIAGAAGYSERQARRLLTALRETGRIGIEYGAGTERDFGAQNLYRLPPGQDVTPRTECPPFFSSFKESLPVIEDSDPEEEQPDKMSGGGQNVRGVPDEPEVERDPVVGAMFKAYETHIGTISADVRDQLIDYAGEYGHQWVIEAVKLGVGKTVKYVGGILRRTRDEGRSSPEAKAVKKVRVSKPTEERRPARDPSDFIIR